MKKSGEARDAYVRAEVATALAHQVRAIRLQRSWTQLDLAKKLGTTQAVVSRLEDPSYGRLSIKTLLDLARVFDAGLRVQFVSLITMLHETYKPKADLRHVPSFEEEAPSVEFYSPIVSSFKRSFESEHMTSPEFLRVVRNAPSGVSTVLTATNARTQTMHNNYLVTNWNRTDEQDYLPI